MKQALFAIGIVVFVILGTVRLLPQPLILAPSTSPRIEFARKYNVFVKVMNDLGQSLERDMADYGQAKKAERSWKDMTNDPGWPGGRK